MVVYFSLLPASRAGSQNEEIPLATMAFFMAGFLSESDNNLPLLSASLQNDSTIEHPYINGTKGMIQFSSTSDADQPAAQALRAAGLFLSG